MDAQKRKHRQAERRAFRVRKTIRGTAAKPRLSVFRSSKHIYAQLIDDENQVTLAAVGSNAKGEADGYGGNIKAASVVGNDPRQVRSRLDALRAEAAALPDAVLVDDQVEIRSFDADH